MKSAMQPANSKKRKNYGIGSEINRALRPRKCRLKGATKRGCFFGFKYREPKMKYTHGDCIKMKECLVNNFEFLEEDCHVMTDINLNDSHATMRSYEILQKIKDLKRLSKRGDTLVIYFSCHGFFDEKKRKPFLNAADGLAVDDRALIELLKEIPRGCATTVIIDACYGGGLAELANELNSEDLVVYTACQPYQQSSGGNRGSVFTNSFVEFIEENHDIVNDNVIRKLHLRFIGSGCLQTPGLACVDSKLTSKIFR